MEITGHVWLLQETEAQIRFLVFGNQQEVPELWLRKYGQLKRTVDFRAGYEKERGDCPRAGRRNCCPWFRRASFQLFCWDLAVPLFLGKILAQRRSGAERLIFDQRTTCNSMSVFRLAAQLR